MSIYTKDLPNIVNDADTTVGDWTYGGLTIGRLYGGCKVTVGKFCSLASGVQIMFLGRHATEDVTTFPFGGIHGQWWNSVNCSPIESQDVIIGSDVWIATGVTILQNSVIGDGAVIGAYSVCKTKIPPYCIAVGNPCKVIKQRFPDAQIEKLLEMRWFDWEQSDINNNLDLICSPKVDELYDIWESTIKNA